MVRILKRVDGRLQEDPDYAEQARAATPLGTATPSPDASAAGQALASFVRDLAARNRTALDALTDEGLKRSIVRSMRGR